MHHKSTIKPKMLILNISKQIEYTNDIFVGVSVIVSSCRALLSTKKMVYVFRGKTTDPDGFVDVQQSYCGTVASRRYKNLGISGRETAEEANKIAQNFVLSLLIPNAIEDADRVLEDLGVSNEERKIIYPEGFALNQGS